MIRKFINFVNEVYCNYNKKIDYDILETLTAQQLEDSTFKFLNKNFLGWIAIDSLRGYLVHIIEWKSNQIFLFNEIYWNNEHRVLQEPSQFNMRFNYSDVHKIKINGIKEIPFNPNDPYGEEIWIGESKKSKKRKASRIKMAEIDPYGEEDWGWDVQINDEDFKGKYLIFKKGFSDGYDYYFGILTSHYQIHASHGISQDLNQIKRYAQIIPLTDREIDRIKKNKIQLVPYMIGGYKYKNAYGNPERVSYSELKKDCFFLDKEYMDNYLYMNESRMNEEYVEFNKYGDELELKRWHNYFDDYIVPFLRKGEWYRIICEKPYDKNDYDILERPGKENKLITKKRKKMLLYVFRFYCTHSDWGWEAIQYDKIYKNGKIENVDPFREYINMDKLRDYKEVKIQHIFNPQIEKEKEELRLLMHPHDPYGEEEWND